MANREPAVHRGLNRSMWGTTLCGRQGRGNSMQAAITYKSSETTCKHCLPIQADLMARKAARN